MTNTPEMAAKGHTGKTQVYGPSRHPINPQ